MNRLILLGLLFLMTFNACKQETYPALKKALKIAGDNKRELVKVLDHYGNRPADSLKLKAARFLITNMRTQYTYFGNALSSTDHVKSQYEIFFNKLGTLWHSNKSGRYKKSQTKMLYDKFQISYATSTLYLKNDLTFMKARYIIDNIDQDFDAWQSYPWSAQVSFKDFCNYILPYKVFNEPLERWRTKIRRRFSWLQDSLSDQISLLEACELINKSIKHDVRFCYTMIKLPDALSFSVLKKIGVGKCDHQVTYMVLILRAMGIPAHVDYVPFRTNSINGHAWVSIKDENNRLYAFDALFGNPNKEEYKHSNIVPLMQGKPGSNVPKVFRKTYQIQNTTFKENKNLQNNVLFLIQ